jgi:hypothetical protein
MEVLSPQLAQAVAAARVALAEAFVLKVGQTLEALVVGKGGDGLTLLKIGDQTVKAALPEGLPPGTLLQLQVKSAGPQPQLAILTQKVPQVSVLVPAVPVEPRAISPATMSAQPVATSRVPPTQNGEVRPALVPVTSQIESNIMEAARPMGEARPLPAAATLTPSPAPGTEPAMPVQAARATAPVSAAEPHGPAVGGQGRPVALPAPVVEARVRAGSAPGPVPAVRGVVVAPLTTAATAPQAAGPPVPAPAAAISAPTALAPVVVAEAKGVVLLAAPIPEGSAAQPAEPEFTHPLLVAQAAPRPQATAAELPRPVAGPNPLPQPAASAPAPLPTTPQAALSQMLPEALARQDSAGPLLQSLAALVQKPAELPEPVLRAALGVLAQRVIATDGKVQPADLERAVLRSGLGLEAGLARSETPVPLDAKAGLLALRAALTKWLGEGPAAVAQQRDAAPPPLKGLPLRAPDLDLAPLPDAPREAMRAVHGQADAAISRLKLMQMASLPDVDPARPSPAALRLELPLLIGHELVMAQFQVSRDGARREAERKRGWTMRFALNYSATGEVGAEVGLLGKAVNVALWAAEPQTAEAMQAALPDLARALEATGLKPGAVRIRHGVPEPEKPPSGQLLDSLS